MNKERIAIYTNKDGKPDKKLLEIGESCWLVTKQGDKIKADAAHFAPGNYWINLAPKPTLLQRIKRKLRNE